MLIPLALALVLVLPQAPDTVPEVRQATAAEAQSAYLDSNARDLVHAARAERSSAAEAITAYETLARQRISVQVEALGRDRLLYRREQASRLHWSRDGMGRVELLGAREVVPMAVEGIEVPDDLLEDAADMAFDPEADHLLDGMTESEFIKHPLAVGSEADYRFRTGDTIRIRLPQGEMVVVQELQVMPRRSDPHLLRGSLWLDAATHGVVRATFQMARPINLIADIAMSDSSVSVDGRESDGIMSAILGDIEGELRYLTIEYGLWDGRWWLPRLIALDAAVDLGSLLSVPVVFEQSYSEYVVEADSLMPGTTTLAMVADSLCNSKGNIVCRCRDGSCRRFEVEAPADTAALLVSEYLPESVYEPGVALITEGEMEELAEQIAEIGSFAGGLYRPHVNLSYLSPSLLRYNRVEGLSVGARLDAALGRLSADATLRYGFADKDVDAELGLNRTLFSSEQRFAAYRRLNSVDRGTRSLGLGNSISALVMGRDDGEYYRTVGAELINRFEPLEMAESTLRLFGERQQTVATAADWSFAQLLGGSDALARPNIVADPADQFGGELTVSFERGLDPDRPRGGIGGSLLASTGSFDFLRPSVNLFGTAPLFAGLAGALDIAAGTSSGAVPVQSLWYVGGPSTVRGFGGASAVRGEAFWAARAELARGTPAMRLILFSDAGWAGERGAFTMSPSLVSAGLGVSTLDGLLRMDLSRALQGGNEWRLDLYFNSAL